MGQEISATGFDEAVVALRKSRPWLDPNLASRLLRAYGTRTERLLGEAGSMADLGPVFGANLTGAEVLYLMREEWAASAADILWRRSKLGLRLTSGEVSMVERFIEDHQRQGGIQGQGDLEPAAGRRKGTAG